MHGVCQVWRRHPFRTRTPRGVKSDDSATDGIPSGRCLMGHGKRQLLAVACGMQALRTEHLH